MVAVQVLLMNYFLLGLHSDKHLTNDVLPPVPLEDCPLGCKLCSPMNGCLSCKAPFVLVLPTETITQRATCKRDCPKDYYNSYNGNSGFCISKIQMKDCKRCTYRTHCLPCRRGRLKGKCHRKCSKGSYFEAICNSCLQNAHTAVTSDTGLYRNRTLVNVLPESSTSEVSPSTKASKSITKEQRKRLKAKRRRRRRRKRKRNKKRKKQRRREKGKRGRKRDRKRHRIRHWKRRKRRRKLSLLKNSAYNYTTSL